MMIVFDGAFGEVIVCEEKDEKSVIEEYFVNGGRDLDYYDRIEVEGDAVVATPSNTVSPDFFCSETGLNPI